MHSCRHHRRKEAVPTERQRLRPGGCGCDGGGGAHSLPSSLSLPPPSRSSTAACSGVSDGRLSPPPVGCEVGRLWSPAFTPPAVTPAPLSPAGTDAFCAVLRSTLSLCACLASSARIVGRHFACSKDGRMLSCRLKSPLWNGSTSVQRVFPGIIRQWTR